MNQSWFSNRLFGRQTLRFATIAAVFVLGIGAFASGVHTSEIPDMGAQSVLAWIYYCAGLFVLGGLDLGTPAGGPLVGQAALWVAFFLAPGLTAATVIEALLLVIRRDRPGFRSLQGHAVLIGGGRLGQTYLQALRAVAPDKPVVHVVERDHASTETGSRSKAVVHVLPILGPDPKLLDLARFGDADEMIVITDDDLLNLETAWTAQQMAPDLAVAVHVADLGLLRPVNRMLREAVGVGTGRQPLVFNTHRIAALRLYEDLLYPHFAKTGYRDVFVLGGFGSFAQTILELLKAMAQDELKHIVVVDVEASGRVRQFGADVALDANSLSTVDGALQDPATWARVDELVATMEATPVYLLASGDEVVNFRTAMLLRARSADARLFARCYRRSRFTEALAAQCAFELFAFEEILEAALQEHYRSLGIV